MPGRGNYNKSDLARAMSAALWGGPAVLLSIRKGQADSDLRCAVPTGPYRTTTTAAAVSRAGPIRAAVQLPARKRTEGGRSALRAGPGPASADG